LEKSELKHDLSDLTFCIPVRIDSQDRLDNLELIVDYLKHHFQTNIIVYEDDLDSKLMGTDLAYKVNQLIFNKNESGKFHRTKILNECYKKSSTRFVANYDTDVLFVPDAYIAAVNRLRNGSCDFIFPYDGKFREISRDKISKIKQTMNVDWIKFEDTNYIHDSSVGGAVFCNKESYRKSGYENENFVQWGFEDNERIQRWITLGMKIERTSNWLIHIEHFRSTNSSPHNESYIANQMEYTNVARMPSDVLKKYISNWNWVN
jgi:hypothetical protein